MPATKQEAVAKAKANGLLCTHCSKLSIPFEARLTKASGVRIRFPRHTRCQCPNATPTIAPPVKPARARMPR